MSDASLDRYIASGLEKAKPKYWTITANFFYSVVGFFFGGHNCFRTFSSSSHLGWILRIFDQS